MTSLLLLLLACGPKVPPEGSTELDVRVAPPASLAQSAQEPGAEPASADAPLPLGTALPDERRGNAEAMKAFLDGEDALKRLQDQAEPKSPQESQERAVKATELAEEAIGHFERAAELDLTLRAYSATRTGDAWRLAAERTRGVQPPAHFPPDGEEEFRAEQALIASDLEAQALMAYQLVLADRVVDPRWKAHARWALHSLPEVGK